MTTKKALRRRIELLEDTIRMMRELDRNENVPSSAFAPLDTFTVPVTTTTSSNLAPWCTTCQRFHMPSAGPCAGTFTYTWPVVTTGTTPT